MSTGALATNLGADPVVSGRAAPLTGMLITVFAVYRPEWVATLVDPAAADPRRG